MGWTHNKGFSATENGFAVGPKGSELQVIDGYGKINYAAIGRGTAFYVDGNAGSDSNDGLSWETAVKTVAAGIALADDDIAKTNHWDRRNLLFINGGAYTEDLVRFPEKTDIIGVGSTDFHAKAQLIGHHIPATAVSGCRFINISFECLTAHPCVTLAAGFHGTAFIGCDFLGNASTTYGISMTDCTELHVERCHFKGYDGGRRFTAGILTAGTTTYNARIIDNYFYTGIGISITNGATGTIIADNFFDVTTFAIDDNSDQATVVNNTWISAATVANSYDLEVTRCAGNTATGSDKTMTVPVIATS